MSSSVEGSLFVKIGFVLDSQSLDDIIEYTRRKLEEEGIGGGFLAAARNYGGVDAGSMVTPASLSTATEDKIERLVNTVEKQTKAIEEAATESAVVSAAAAPEVGSAYGPERWSWLKQKDTGIFAGTMDKKFFEGVNEYVENYMRNVKGFAMKKPYPYERFSPAGWIEETMGTNELALATVGASVEGGAPAKKLLERLLGEDIPEGLQEKIDYFTSGDEDVSLRHIYAGFGKGGKGARFELDFQQASLTEAGAEKASAFSKELMDYVNDRMRNDEKFYRTLTEVMADVISGARGGGIDPITKREAGERISGANMQVQTAITSGLVDEAVARVVMGQQGGNIFLRRISEGAQPYMTGGGRVEQRGRNLTRGMGLVRNADGDLVFGPNRELTTLYPVDVQASMKAAHLGGALFRQLFPRAIEWGGDPDRVPDSEERKEELRLEVEEGIVGAGEISGSHAVARDFSASGVLHYLNEFMGFKIPEGKVGAEERKVRYMPSFAESQRDLEISAEMDALILADTEGKFSPQEKIEAAIRHRQVKSTALYHPYSPARRFMMPGVSGGYITEGDPLEPFPKQRDWSPAWGGRKLPTQTQVADEIAFGDADARVGGMGAPGEGIGALFDGTLEALVERKAQEGLDAYNRYVEGIRTDLNQTLERLGLSVGRNPFVIGGGKGEGEKRKGHDLVIVKGPRSSKITRSGSTSDSLTTEIEKEFGTLGGSKEEGIVRETFVVEE